MAQRVETQSGAFGQLVQQQVLEHALGKAIGQRQRAAAEARAMIGQRPVEVGAGNLKEKLREWQGVLHQFAKGIGAQAAHHGIGVVALGQEQEACGAAVAQCRQANVQRAARGAAPGGVTVETEDQVAGVLEQLLQMVLGDRRAQGRHHVADAELSERDYIQVAFDHQYRRIAA